MTILIELSCTISGTASWMQAGGYVIARSCGLAFSRRQVPTGIGTRQLSTVREINLDKYKSNALFWRYEFKAELISVDQLFG